MPQEETSTPPNNTTNNSMKLLPNCVTPLLSILISSLKLIFIQHPKLMLTIYTTCSLPASIFLTYLSLSPTPRKLKSHIDRLNGLSLIVDNWVEAGNIKETSRRDLKLLYRFKVVHFFPVLLFSVFTLVAVVNTLTCRRKSKPTLRAAAAALTVGWTRPVITCVLTGLFSALYGHVVPLLINFVGYPKAVVVSGVAVVVEIYVMMVFSVAMVVSVAEERYGVEAVRVGSGLIKGRRVTGWVLSGLVVLIVNGVGRMLVGVMEGGDWVGGYKWTAEIGLVILLGVVVLWSYVLVTVFYCHCRKVNGVIRDDDDDVELLDYDIEN